MKMNASAITAGNHSLPLLNLVVSEPKQAAPSTKLTHQKIEEVFSRLYGRLCAQALRYVKDPMKAEEMVSDVFYKIWKGRHTLKVNTSVESYFFMSVRNNCLDFVRKKTWPVHGLEGDGLDGLYTSSTPLQETIGGELELQIERVVESLPADRKRIFKMSRERGMKYHEIAEELNISIKTVETQISRSLKLLRQELSEYLFA